MITFIFPANIGGLLGLFMGFSVFSIIEIVYFLSIRPYFRYLRDNENYRQTLQHLTQRLQNIRMRDEKHTIQKNAFLVEDVILPHVN